MVAARTGNNRSNIAIRYRDPREVIDLARKYTRQSIDKLFDLMMDKPHLLIDPKTGETIVVKAEVPPAVQMRCAEILLERGYGKTPQAVLVASDGSLPEGMRAIPLLDRIAALQQARTNALEEGSTRLLEASEQREILELESGDGHELV